MHLGAGVIFSNCIYLLVCLLLLCVCRHTRRTRRQLPGVLSVCPVSPGSAKLRFLGLLGTSHLAMSGAGMFTGILPMDSEEK